jgi:integrase
MSYSFAKGKWEVRWRDATGKQRSRRFDDEQLAVAFDDAVGGVDPDERSDSKADYGSQGGVYPYETKEGTRWRYVARRSDGSPTSKRGFTSPRAARDAKRRLTEKVERGELRHTKRTFGSWWQEWLPSRKPYLEPGSWDNYEVHGRKRLLPVLQATRLERLDEGPLHELVDVLAEEIDAEELGPKTANNALGTLVVCLNAAVKEKLIPRNPALEIERFPLDHVERDYLRMLEIPRYLESCSDLYRPLAEVLLRDGLRISEAIALQREDLELDDNGGAIVVYRSHKRGAKRKSSGKRKTVVGSTKSDKFRRVEVGPRQSTMLRTHLAHRATQPGGDAPKALVFVMPRRTTKRSNGRWEGAGAWGPMDRNTVSRGWHKAALEDAALRDMPLHALRHTAAAAWLASGNTLAYVQHQLGHASITTTQRYYGHLERNVLAAGATITEEEIDRLTDLAA